MKHISEKNRYSPIGVLDSGVGGITVLKEAMRLLPRENYIYYADTGNAPYGTKSRRDVTTHVSMASFFLMGLGIKALVIACNTATSAAVSQLRQTYCIPIIGMEPAVKPAIKENGEGQKVLVIATPLTLAEDKFRNLINSINGKGKVDIIPAPQLVVFAEKGSFTSPHVIKYIEGIFSKIDMKQYGVLVLGCTHYIYFRETIRSVLPEYIKVIDGNEGTVRNLKNILEEYSLLNPEGQGLASYYTTGNKAAAGRDAERFRRFLDLAP